MIAPRSGAGTGACPYKLNILLVVIFWFNYSDLGLSKLAPQSPNSGDSKTLKTPETLLTPT
jgi:hypothetical protein